MTVSWSVSSTAIEVTIWMSNYIPHEITDVIAYSRPTLVISDDFPVIISLSCITHAWFTLTNLTAGSRPRWRIIVAKENRLSAAPEPTAAVHGVASDLVLTMTHVLTAIRRWLTELTCTCKQEYATVRDNGSHRRGDGVKQITCTGLRSIFII